MKTRRARDLPFTITYSKDGQRVVRRAKDPKEAWRLMMETNGQLHMAFRTA